MPITSTLKPFIILYLIILLMTGCESNKNRHSLTDAQGNKNIETPKVDDPTPAEPSPLDQAILAFRAFNQHNNSITKTMFDCTSMEENSECGLREIKKEKIDIVVDLPFVSEKELEYDTLEIYGDASNDKGNQYLYTTNEDDQKEKYPNKSFYFVQPTTISVPRNADENHEFYLSRYEDNTTTADRTVLFIATEFDIDESTNAPNSPIRHQHNAYIETETIEIANTFYSRFIVHVQLLNGSTQSFKTEDLEIDKESIFHDYDSEHLQLSDPHGTPVGYVFFRTITENPELTFTVIEFYDKNKELF